MLATIRLRARLMTPAGVPFGLYVAYGLTAGLSLSHALVYDPELDLGCWRTCTANVFLTTSQPGMSDALSHAIEWLILALALVVVALAVERFLRASRGTVRGSTVTFAALGATGAALGGQAALLAQRSVEDPADQVLAAAYAVLALGLLMLALGTGWTELSALRVRRSVARLARDLARAPEAGSLEEVLRASLGDPSLTVAYPVTDAETYVDAGGHLVTPDVGGGRATATIARGRPPACRGDP